MPVVFRILYLSLNFFFANEDPYSSKTNRQNGKDSTSEFLKVLLEVTAHRNSRRLPVSQNASGSSLALALIACHHAQGFTEFFLFPHMIPCVLLVNRAELPS